MKTKYPRAALSLVRQMTRAQLTVALFDVAKNGHYTFDKTYLLRKWLRQAIRFGSVKAVDLRRIMRSSQKRHWCNS